MTLSLLQPSSFYVAGGTLQRDAPCYVSRQADSDLFNGLMAGKFCYVLTSRQMGKSSLMVRTAIRLREAGVAVAVLDLTAVGQNLTPEQWYDGLLSRVGRDLNLEDELEDFWLEQDRLGPLERFMRAIREVVLTKVSGPVVLFVDEIDAVRNLPFSTDEFFAAIRECYNRRTQDPQMNRLAFGLLGVATPADLIRDARTTPFNIGTRIELTDFTEAEAQPLAEGLNHPPAASSAATPREGREKSGGSGAILLKRILYWTGGHPYLTQRLCAATAEALAASSADAPLPADGPRLIDRLCHDLFLSTRAREQDDNLQFVRDRLLRLEPDLAGLLDAYAQVRAGRRVPDDPNAPFVNALRLSGVTRSVNGRLIVGNRIYAHVFDRAWITASMPDAELRRQRAAYLRGLLRAVVLSGLVAAAMGGLLYRAVLAERRADAYASQVKDDDKKLQENNVALQNRTNELAKKNEELQRRTNEAEANRKIAQAEADNLKREKVKTSWLTASNIEKLRKNLALLKANQQATQRANIQQNKAHGLYNAFSDSAQFFLDPKYISVDAAHTEEYYNRALSVHRTLGNQQKMAECYAGLGALYFAKHNYRQCLANYKNALVNFEQTEDSEGCTKCLLGLGIVYVELGGFAEANACYDRVSHLCQILDTKAGNNTHMAAWYAAVGDWYYKQKNRKDARIYYNHALRFLEDDEIKGKVLTNLIEICHWLGEINRSNDYERLLQQRKQRPQRQSSLPSAHNL